MQTINASQAVSPSKQSRRAHWHQRARKALDRWTPSLETSVAVELEAAFDDGLRSAAQYVVDHGQRELAGALRRMT